MGRHGSTSMWKNGCLRRSESYLAEVQRADAYGEWGLARTRMGRLLYLSEEWYRIYGFDPRQGPCRLGKTGSSACIRRI